MSQEHLFPQTVLTEVISDSLRRSREIGRTILTMTAGGGMIRFQN